MYLKRGNKTGGNYNSEEQPTSLAGSKMRSTDQRSPVRVDKDTGESYAEMFYLDPNDVNFHRNQVMSPSTEGRQSRVRSPLGQSVISSVRNDLKERSDTANVMGKYPIPTFSVNLGGKNVDRLSRSPKTINIGETEKDVEYNIRTLNAGRSPKNNNMNKDMYQTYTNIPDKEIFSLINQ